MIKEANVPQWTTSSGRVVYSLQEAQIEELKSIFSQVDAPSGEYWPETAAKTVLAHAEPIQAVLAMTPAKPKVKRGRPRGARNKPAEGQAAVSTESPAAGSADPAAQGATAVNPAAIG